MIDRFSVSHGLLRLILRKPKELLLGSSRINYRKDGRHKQEKRPELIGNWMDRKLLLLISKSEQ